LGIENAKLEAIERKFEKIEEGSPYRTDFA